MDEYILADGFLSLEPLSEEQSADVNLHTFQKVPLDTLLGIGGGIADLVTKQQDADEKGLFKIINTKAKEQLTDLPNNSEKIPGAKAPAILQPNGIFDQGVLFPALNIVNLDPAALAINIALSLISEKLGKIEEKQDTILDFLETDKRTKLEGTLNYLTEVYNNYKYNWNDDLYKRTAHNQTQNIKREAEHDITFYRKQIEQTLEKKHHIFNNKNARESTVELLNLLKSYRLALYLYAFSSFLEVLLLESHNEHYLKSVSAKIREYAFRYSELYTKCYTLMSDAIKGSIGSELLKTASSVSTAAGKFINKIPVIEKGPVDEALIAAGDKIKEYRDDSAEGILYDLVSVYNPQVAQFADVIDMINELHNSQVELLLDDENLYVKTGV